VHLKTKLKELREARHLTQDALAKVMGVSRQTIHSIETNKYIASLPLAIKLANYFKTRVEDIFHL
jgi:putative transcriptional regulator